MGTESACNAGDTGDKGSVPGSGRLLEQEIATHSSILAWKIPWMEKPGGMQSKGLHGWRSLVGCSPKGCKELDRTE